MSPNPAVRLRFAPCRTDHLSVVADDIKMLINRVVCGADQISDTPKQILSA